MSKDMPLVGDEKTRMVARDQNASKATPVTDSEPPPVIEDLEGRMIFSARTKPAERLNVGVNPLVAAASELLSYLVWIKHSKAVPELPGLYTYLSNALKVFEANALHNGVEHLQMMKARYVLCTVLDEAIVTAGWSNTGDWSQKSLLSNFHNETFGGEKVFQSLGQLLRDPVRNLSLLELLYLCLSLGFEGKYRVVERGMTELDSIRDALYRQIRHLRGDVPRELSPHWQGLNDRRRSLIRSVPGWLLAGLTLGCLAVMFSGFAWVLGEQRETVLQPYQQFDSSPAIVNRNR